MTIADLRKLKGTDGNDYTFKFFHGFHLVDVFIISPDKYIYDEYAPMNEYYLCLKSIRNKNLAPYY